MKDTLENELTCTAVTSFQRSHHLLYSKKCEPGIVMKKINWFSPFFVLQMEK